MRHHRHSVTENPAQIGFIAAFAAIIGAATAMLFTPRSGPQVRRGLKRRADHLKDEVHEHFDATGDDPAEVVEDVKQKLQSKASKVAADTKATATKAKVDAKATATRAKTTARRAAKRVSDDS